MSGKWYASIAAPMPSKTPTKSLIGPNFKSMRAAISPRTQAIIIVNIFVIISVCKWLYCGFIKLAVIFFNSRI